MKHLNLLAVILLLIFASAHTLVMAQVPQNILYQAVIRNAKGELIKNEPIGYRISIYKDSPSGEMVYQEASELQTNSNGLITITYGIGKKFSEIDWSYGTYYIVTEFDPQGGDNFTLHGNSQLLSVPYALYTEMANSAKNAGNGYTGKKNSIHMGQGSGVSSSGEMNVYIGDSAGYKNTTGTRNTAVGYLSSYSNESGEWNTSIGSRSLKSNTTGKGNTATGHRALFSNNAGWYNTAGGFYALHNNTTGYSNVAIGTGALFSNTDRSNLVAIGDSALYWNGTGATATLHSKYNTAVGSKALYSNTTGYHNTANGYQALYYNTYGYHNTANGYQALYSNTTGYHNTANGYNALYSNTTGYHNTANGYNALYSNTTGDYNTANGNYSLGYNTTGNNNSAFGYGADVFPDNLNNATAIGSGAKVNASNKVRIGNSSVTVIEGQVSWSVGSDIRLKDNVVYHNKLGLDFIKDLKTVSFTYKNDSAHARHDGLIAQDVQETMKKLGVEFSGLIVNDNEEKTLNLSYAEFVIPLINSVQEQQKQIEELKKQVEQLKKLLEQNNR